MNVDAANREPAAARRAPPTRGGADPGRHPSDSLGTPAVGTGARPGRVTRPSDSSGLNGWASCNLDVTGRVGFEATPEFLTNG